MDLSHVSFVGVSPALPKVPATRRAAAAVVLPHTETPRGALGTASDSLTLDPFAAWLLQRTGVAGELYRPKAVQRRIGACLRSLRASSRDSARKLIERRPELAALALDTLLIGVSEFFRDHAVFECLATTVLPELLATRPRIRVCSVGASGGQELYSVAMLLAEAGALDRSELLGIDCRSDAIARAAQGEFTDVELAGVDAERRARHFVQKASAFRVRAELRARVSWRLADVFSFAATEPWDLILFRNVAIYFRPEHVVSAWTRLVSSLSAQGCIVTGTAEKPPASLPLQRVASSVYRKPG